MITTALYVADALGETNIGTVLYFNTNVYLQGKPRLPSNHVLITTLTLSHVLTYHSQCVYHPAPLTKTRASPDTAVASTSLPASSDRASPVQQQTTPVSPPSMMPNAFIPDQPSSRKSAPAHSFPGSPALPRTLGAARGTQMLSTASHRSPENYTSRDARTGFLGPTSYSAVYTENSGKRL